MALVMDSIWSGFSHLRMHGGLTNQASHGSRALVIPLISVSRTIITNALTFLVFDL